MPILFVKCLSSRGIPMCKSATSLQMRWLLLPKCARNLSSASLAGSTKKHFERRLVKHSAQQLYQVVADVGSYSQFVPWCTGSTVNYKNSSGDRIEADLDVGFGALKERYTSRVHLDKSAHPVLKISSDSSQTSFIDHLTTSWTFTPVSYHPPQPP